ncbi:hypothetical protein LBMAG33_2970 [Candidatus Levyibacteriota bacterium]|nr:hypothetical protein [Candidatus Levybacteria bacterium]MSU25941.1 hypothetical protein [Candidatus Levybacteria bacterium]GDX61987.1 hypothetical protein LBMAG33_2970 [Candidatus Levybacteria bacterium]
MEEKFIIKEFHKKYPNSHACLEEISKLRWPRGIFCIKCNKITKFYHVKKRTSYACEFCGIHIYPLTATIFEKSTTPLTTWFLAIYLMVQTRCGISIKQLQRILMVTYKTAWRMQKSIKAHMPDSMITGLVINDETFIKNIFSTKLLS